MQGDRQMHGIAAQVALGEIGEGSRHHSPHLGAIQVRMYEGGANDARKRLAYGSR